MAQRKPLICPPSDPAIHIFLGEIEQQQGWVELNHEMTTRDRGHITDVLTSTFCLTCTSFQPPAAEMALRRAGYHPEALGLLSLRSVRSRD